MRHEETHIQISFITWIKYQYPQYAPFVIHVPNGGKMSVIKGMILKKMGVKAGVADILFMWKNESFGGLWLEFKTKKGQQSEEQKKFEKLCNIAQYDYQLVRSLDDAINIFNRYMKYELNKSTA